MYKIELYLYKNTTMGNRTQRLLAIKEIISNNKISTQEQLLRLLEEKGMTYTQATLSRDLKFLKVNKIADPEYGYIYALSEQHQAISKKAENLASRGFVSLTFARGLGIIKTLPGYAGSVAALIDEANIFEIAGTIAGDDTVLVIPHDGVSDKDIVNALVVILPEIKSKINN